MKKTTIIFDFDGTIADSLQLVVAVVNDIAVEETGKQLVSQDQLAGLRSKTVSEILNILQIPMWKLPFFLLKGKKLFKEKSGSLICFPGMKETLFELKKEGYALGILSSNAKDIIELFLKANRIDQFTFIHSESNLFGKSTALKHVLESNLLKQEEVLYVGDEARDIEACKKLPIDVAAVTWGFNSRELLEKYSPTYIVDKPEELLKVLN